MTRVEFHFKQFRKPKKSSKGSFIFFGLGRLTIYFFEIRGRRLKATPRQLYKTIHLKAI